MIKKSIRSLVRLGLIGGLTLTTYCWLTSDLKSLALPKEQIVQILQKFPVFATVDAKGSLIVFPIQDKDTKQLVTYVFISPNDANRFFEDQKKNQPELAKQEQVLPLPLSIIYEAQLAQTNPNELAFLYIPEEKQVEEAKKILAKNGQKYEGGVPLFMARSMKDKGYLTIGENNDKVIPMFFKLSQLENLMVKLKKENPALAADLKIEVGFLEGYIANIKDSNDPNIGKFLLVPSEESVKAVQAAQPRPGSK